MTLGLVGSSTSRGHLDWWPRHTTVLADDIVVDGVSLLSLAETSGTPAVQTGATMNEPRRQTEAIERVAVLVVRVVAMTQHRAGRPIIQVDARLDNLRLIWSEARRIGGVPTHRHREVLAVRRPGRDDLECADDIISVVLPANLRVGDLLAIPSRPIPVDPARPLHPLTGRLDGVPDSIFASVS